MKSFNNINIQRLCKYGFAALVFFAGSVPVMAQDNSEAEATETAAPKKKVKTVKKYPTVEIKGKVIDAATGEPLAGAQIHAYNNSNYTAMTDENGEFVLNAPKFVTAVSVKLEGYNLNSVSLNGRTADVNVSLYSDFYSSDTKSSTLPSRSVKTEGFEKTTAITIDEEIQSRLGSEVRAISRSSIPGQGMSMFMNGLTSLNSNAQPLIIVDGVIFDQLYDKTMLHTGYFNNLLQGINPMDIESVEVLKNGTAIYGMKAANGVIVIKTKRCHSMATRIDVNIDAGVELVPGTMSVMNASEYRGYASEMLKTTDTKLQSFHFLTNDPTDQPYYSQYHNNTDWKKEVYRTAITQNYGINIQGGDDIAKYNLSVGYTNAKSTLKKNDMQRFNIRFNTDISLNKWFTTQFDAAYTNVTRNLRSNGLDSEFDLNACASTSFLGLAKAPFLSPYDFSTDGQVSEFISDADTYLSEVITGNKASVANPTAILENGEAKNKNYSDCTMISLTIAPKWQPTKNFSLSERFSYQMQSFDEAYFTPIIGMPTYQIPGNISQTENSKWSYYSKHNSVFSDTRADWEILQNGEHRVNLFGGFRFMNDSYTSSALIGDNTSNDKTPNNTYGQKSKKRLGVDDSWKSMSYYLNADYNYQERYYLQGQVTLETSSRFGKEVDAGLKMFGVAWAVFPSVQAAWVMTNEKWMKPTKYLNSLKFNVGFESTGNDGINNSANRTYMTSSSLLNDEVTSIGLSNIGNSKLRWETTNRLNAGFEGNFFENRLNLQFNYFYGKTSNLITLGSLAYVSGLTEYYTNDGKMSNQGVNFAASGKIVNNRSFKFELGLSLGHYKNKLLELPEGKESFTTDVYGGTIISKVGEAAGMFYGYQTDGVYSTTEEVKKDGYVNAANGGKPFVAGDMRFVDTNGDKIIDDKDRQIIGNPNPDIYGNINLKFRFGQRWDLSAVFNYSLGNDIYNYQRALLESGSMFINQTTAMNRRWIAEGQVTDMPRASYGDPTGNSRFSDRWIEDGSYMRLKNITVSYKIPVQNQYIQGISVWAAANNLFTLTKYLGNDPEVSCGNSVLLQGIDAGYLNCGRSFHLGVKINL